MGNSKGERHAGGKIFSANGDCIGHIEPTPVDVTPPKSVKQVPQLPSLSNDSQEADIHHATQPDQYNIFSVPSQKLSEVNTL